MITHHCQRFWPDLLDHAMNGHHPLLAEPLVAETPSDEDSGWVPTTCFFLRICAFAQEGTSVTSEKKEFYSPMRKSIFAAQMRRSLTCAFAQQESICAFAQLQSEFSICFRISRHIRNGSLQIFPSKYFNIFCKF
jgi:hypothetical protein